MKKVIVGVLALTILGAGFWFFKDAEDAKIDVIHPKTMKAVQAVYATGTVEAARMIPIAPKISARLIALNVDEGAKIKTGDLLAQLESTDVQSTLKQLQAQATLAGKELNRTRILAKSGALSKQALDQAQAAYDSAAASVEKSKADLSYLQLIAPEDGTIIRRDGEIGEMIAANTTVFWVNGGDALRIETEVDEEDIPFVKIGQNVLIAADAFAGQTFHGKVLAITPKGDPVARSYRVRVSIDGNTPMMIGMTAETNIITAQKNSALMVPVTAVKNGQIQIVQKDGVASRPVTTGIKTDKTIEITDGVSAADIVVQSYDSTLNGQKQRTILIEKWDGVVTAP